DEQGSPFGWALRIYEKQLRNDLGTTVTLNNYAVSLIRINRWTEAEKKFKDVLQRIKKFPDNEVRELMHTSKMDFIASIYYNLGKLYLHMSSEASEKKLPFKHFAEKSCSSFNEAIQHHQDIAKRIEAESSFAEALYFLGKTTEADRLLKHLEHKCFGKVGFKKLLTNIYRRQAMIRLFQNEVDDAMALCYRALETSLLFAHPAEEMEVIDTFMDLLRISSKILFEHISDLVERVRIANSQGHKLIDNLVEFLEKKDLYTGLHHSFNVCQLSVRMGEVIADNTSIFGDCNNGDPENLIQLDILGVAGMLHDIGKLQVPWAVINKILPLREEEWQLIKEHPVNGYRILDSFYLSEVGKIVIEHHEKIDGSGYPWGRKKLSMMGAIVALADVYEAMTTINRLYRQAKPKDVALAELKSLSGIHYDPRAVKALTMAMG
ncbi:HD domain-containing phosphohydrolase, partial [candidate division CSSED10-310 bacterium]